MYNKIMLSKATIAGGCFWCTEAVFSKLKGVISVTPGYSGGDRKNPTYQEVCSGETGHAEVIQIEFDPDKISYKDLLYFFLKTHDPTQVNGQGNDIGTQYRSVIFYHDDKQKKEAEESKSEAQKLFKEPIVTEIIPFKNFFPAEQSHREYYLKNSSAPYCRLVIDPKIEKLKKDFKPLLK